VEGGTHVQREVPEKLFGVPLYFLALHVQLAVFGERLRDEQYISASFWFAFLLLTVPPLAVPSHL